MFSVLSGDPIAIIRGGPHEGEILGITEKGDAQALASDIEFGTGALEPLMGTRARCVEYIAGPSGAGKSTYLAGLLRRYLKLRPGAEVYLFSRGAGTDEPAFDDLRPAIKQVVLDEDLVKAPPDVTKMEPGTALVFDDVGTIHDDKLRKAVEKIIMDCAEVGRKYSIYLLVTSHLIIPADRNFARVMMNEMQYLTVFPGGGGGSAISYVLKKHVCLRTKQIERVNETESRWVRIHTHAPRWAMTEKAAYVV
jgi:hypothetical protein